MEPPAQKPQKEREDTDESLRFERSKTDDELESARRHIEDDADRVLAVARERAEAVLETARDRNDKDRAADGVGQTTQLQRGIDAERGEEDRVVAEERATADERLYVERAERKRALASLLSLEREATDEHLLVERGRADETVEARDDFLGMVSHDLRTLLGGIALNTALLTKQAQQQGEAGAETLQRAERIQRFAARMNRLVGDLIDVVSLEAGKLAVSPQPRDAVNLVRDAVDAYEPLFAAKGITLTSRIDVGSLLAEFDEERVLQVLANMLSNALKFTERGGYVTITVEPVETQVRFSVTDTGIGIPEGQERAIFERFRQVLTKDRRGLGLGLYIAKCIVEAHGGKIWAERGAQGGTSLHFTLPGAKTS